MEQQKQITVDQAFANLVNVCAVFKGDLREHTALQESLKLIKEKLDEKKTAEPNNPADH